MWTCKKCGNTEIMMKEIEIIERVGRVSDNGKMEYERYKKTNKSIVYHCSICGAEENNLFDLCERTRDMYLTYWEIELENLHKKYAKRLKECKSNEGKLQLFKDKEEDLYGLILKSSTYLVDILYKIFEEEVLKAIKNCQYRINKYTILSKGNKIWYITDKLIIRRCYSNEEPLNKLKHGQYKFWNRESCENYLEELKKYIDKIK